MTLGGPPAHFAGDRFSGDIDEMSPEEGDCVMQPVTRISVRGHGSLTG